MSNLPLAATVQAILFAASEPVSIAQLADASQASVAHVEQALEALKPELEKTSGLRLSQLHGSYQLVSAPEAAPAIKRFLATESSTELSRAALETLAIVAYRGPITRATIEAIRGVASETMVRNLLARGLITEGGKSQEPGRAVLYTVSHGFLEHFGLTSPEDLPPLPESAEADNDSAEGSKPKEPTA